jgi:probable rRNA maturation factor
MVEIKNLSGVKIDKNFIKRVTEKVLKEEGKKMNLSIVLLKEKEVKRINKKYLKKNASTDVLSFGLDKLTGEIVLCPKKIKENAQRYKTSFKRELINCTIHGILHLLNYSDKTEKERKKMEEKQKYYLCKIYG